jgi:predicted CoA-binding protein
MALNAMPTQDLVEMALDYNIVTLIGDHSVNPKGWKHTIEVLNRKKWRFYLVDPDHAGQSFEGQTLLGSAEEIHHFVPLIQFMDTTQKDRWFDLASGRMEVWGDIQMLWMQKGCAVTQRDRDDAHAYGWSIIEGECLANRLSK